MLETIEKLRKKHKVSKAELCRNISISKAQYYNYLNGASVPFSKIQTMLKVLGYKLIITTEYVEEIQDVTLITRIDKE